MKGTAIEMKKNLWFSLGIVIAMLPGSAFCQSPADPLVPNVPSARIWDNLSISHKTILIGGLLVGYRSGVAAGAASEHRKLKNNSTDSQTAADELIEKAKTLFYRPVNFYVKQTDTFLQAFPVCKALKITHLLDQLAAAWAYTELKDHMGYDFIKEVAYEDVEKSCLAEAPK